MSNRFRRVVTIGLSAGVLMAVMLSQQTTTIGQTEMPKPIAHWVFDQSKVVDGKIPDQAGKHHATISGTPRFRTEPTPALELHNETDLALVKDRLSAQIAPKDQLAILAWVRIDRGNKLGGILSCARRHYDMDGGFFLGYTQNQFQFGLTSELARDREGTMTLLTGKTRFTPNKWYHVAATYDGKEMKLFVNGQLDGTVSEQAGAIKYANSNLFLGRFQDDDEDYPMFGAIREVQLFNKMVSPEQIAMHYADNRTLTEKPADTPPPHFVVSPYLQNPTKTSIVIMWETSQPGTSIVEFGPEANQLKAVTSEKSTVDHEVFLSGLTEETKYIYRVKTQFADGTTLHSDFRTFQTAVKDQSAFTFAVIGDTQRNPRMTGIICDQIWKSRPHLLLHNGDVVDTGPDKNEWVYELFHPGKELFGRVPLFPTIGNHERNHPHYYKYFSLPKPEYYYTFTFGNAQFFAIDSNKKLDPGSEQYEWLDRELGKSTAKWKFVYHHHPAYSSDDNDYGDTWRSSSTKYRDSNAGKLIELYEKHNVDINFNGHIHVYERSWPLRGNKIDPDKGVMYITSGGGGANLENFAPTPAWFKAQCRVDYHYCLVNIHENRMEFKVFDRQNRLFDSFDRLKK